MFWGRIKMMKIVTMEFLMKENRYPPPPTNTTQKTCIMGNFYSAHVLVGAHEHYFTKLNVCIFFFNIFYAWYASLSEMSAFHYKS